MKKTSIALLLLLMLCIIVACSSNSNNSQKGESIQKTLDSYNYKATATKEKAITFSEYNFGDNIYTSPYGREMPYTIRGIIAYPNEAGSYPLILITHGSHSNDDESLRFDTGFEYLVKGLARQGFVVASMDMSKPYIWKYGDNDDREKSVAIAREHIRNLLLVSDGQQEINELDLKSKIDASKIGLIGHSRGGETIHDIAINERANNVNIHSLLSLAPTQFFERNWQSDIHCAIIVPEYDGDIISLDGYAMFDILADINPESLSVIQLLRANHNFFNSNIDRNDASFSHIVGAEETHLTAQEQQTFIQSFAADYFNHTLKEDSSLFSFSDSQPNTLYDYDVSLIYQHKASTKVADSTAQFNTESSTVSVEQKNDSWYYLDDEVILDTITYGDNKYKFRPMLQIEWQDATSQLTIPLSQHNFTTYKSIALRVVNNAASELNPKDSSQKFSIELIDNDEQKQRVILPNNLNALAYLPGEIETTEIFENTATNWSRVTPINMINIPLNLFDHIDLAQIKAINLVFDQVDKGSIFLDSIWLN